MQFVFDLTLLKTASEIFLIFVGLRMFSKLLNGGYFGRPPKDKDESQEKDK
jgi:hypothetical protein